MQKILKFIKNLPNGGRLVGGSPITLSPLYFRGWFSIILWLNSFGKKEFIISTYTSYEWIHTDSGFFKFPFVWDLKLQGYKEFTVEEDDGNPDNVRYHTPYM